MGFWVVVSLFFWGVCVGFGFVWCVFGGGVHLVRGLGFYGFFYGCFGVSWLVGELWGFFVG